MEDGTQELYSGPESPDHKDKNLFCVASLLSVEDRCSELSHLVHCIEGPKPRKKLKNSFLAHKFENQTLQS